MGPPKSTERYTKRHNVSSDDENISFCACWSSRDIIRQLLCLFRSQKTFKSRIQEEIAKKRKSKAHKQSSSGNTVLPDLKDHEAVQQFFLQQIQLGEELLGNGDIDAGVEHLSNAVAVCGQPQQLLQVLQQTLPPQVFSLLLERLPSVGQRLMARAAQSGMGMAEDDVE